MLRSKASCFSILRCSDRTSDRTCSWKYDPSGRASIPVTCVYSISSHHNTSLWSDMLLDVWSQRQRFNTCHVCVLCQFTTQHITMIGHAPGSMIPAVELQYLSLVCTLSVHNTAHHYDRTCSWKYDPSGRASIPVTCVYSVSSHRNTSLCKYPDI